MAFWIPVTLCAALFQAWRTALQQGMRTVLSANAAGFVRFLYGVPVGMALLLADSLAAGRGLPVPTPGFLLFCALGGASQVVATVLLIKAFGFRNFAVGTAYAKTEALTTALVAWAVLGEALSPLAWAGVGLGVYGVLTLSLAGKGLGPRRMLAASLQPAALCGLAAGAGLGTASVLIKLAMFRLDDASVVHGALFTLVAMNAMQTAMQGAWLLARDPRQFSASLFHWRRAAWVGAMSACGSACWFTAFALAPVALVRILGQVEIVFVLGFSRFYLRESVRRPELAGMALVIGGVVLVVLSR